MIRTVILGVLPVRVVKSANWKVSIMPCESGSAEGSIVRWCITNGNPRFSEESLLKYVPSFGHSGELSIRIISYGHCRCLDFICIFYRDFDILT